MDRHLEPELLDELPADDPQARRSRADLRRLNALMGHARVIARELKRTPCVKRLCDIGGGDATLTLAVARRLGWRDVDLTIIDRQDIVSDETKARFAALGWKINVISADVFSSWESRRFDAVTANLFLHHFEGAALSGLFSQIAPRTAFFVACEPSRSALASLASRAVKLIGCNDVTRHDAIVSVRAGFAGDELAALWPASNRWGLDERRSGLFSHLFVAQRV